MSKPTMGIFGLTGCAGDQLVILNCEDEILDLVSLVDIRDFLMASSAHDDCELDVALVEGAVCTRRDAERLEAIRKRSKLLVALGTCAVWGGVSAMDRGRDREALLQDVYGEAGLKYDAIPTKALHEVVKVDLNITGCPIEKAEVLGAVAALLHGDPPVYPSYPVCTECRMQENNCLLVEQGLPCCGPVTAAGCNARCLEFRVPCVGCRGPAKDANLSSLVAIMEEKGLGRDRIADRLRIFSPQGVA
jgi:sulfhydrogenase subunit delta